jgi:hypothetical protein
VMCNIRRFFVFGFCRQMSVAILSVMIVLGYMKRILHG